MFFGALGGNIFFFFIPVAVNDDYNMYRTLFELFDDKLMFSY